MYIFLILGGCSASAPIPLSIDLIEPDRGVVLAPVAIEIHGDGFVVNVTQRLDRARGMAIKSDFSALLHGREGIPVALLEVERIDRNRLHAVVPAAIALGRYAIHVRTPLGHEVVKEEAYVALAGCVDEDGDGFGSGAYGNLDCEFAGVDPNDRDPTTCADTDGDGCDDCYSAGFDPEKDGPDFDRDGICDHGDPDDDNDGVSDDIDTNDLDPNTCIDADHDHCDDCALGTDGLGPLADNDTGHDGPDFDNDGACDDGDGDDDNDGSPGEDDSDDNDAYVCSDTDADGCEDCSSGSFDPADDGTDNDGDGHCSGGDCDDTVDTGDLCFTTCSTYYRDADGDGYGDVAVPILACSRPPGYVADDRDCEDTTACGTLCAPDLTESWAETNCADGHDNDCDTHADAADSACQALAECTYLTWATAFEPASTYAQPEYAVDPIPRGQTYATGDWSARTLLWVTALDAGIRTEPITQVEVVIVFTLSGLLAADGLSAVIAYDDVTQGAPVSFALEDLNAAEGRQGLSFAAVDVSAARAWAWSDLAGNLDVILDQSLVSGDGREISIDAVGLRFRFRCNSVPQASLSVTPISLPEGNAVIADATVSDAEDAAADLEVRWDWQGDRIWDTAYSTSKTATHTYAATGVFTVALEVRDLGGASAFAETTVVVFPSSAHVSLVSSGAELVSAVNNIGLTSGPDIILFNSPLVVALPTEPDPITDDVSIIGDGTVEVDGSSLVGIYNCFRIVGGNVLFAGLDIHDCPWDAIHSDGGTLEVRDCHLRDNGDDGLELHDATNQTIGPGNVIEGNEGDGIALNGFATDEFVIRGNVIRNNTMDGIYGGGGNSNGIIEQNVIWSNEYNVGFRIGSVNNLLRFNTLSSARRDNLRLDSSTCTGWDIRNNIFAGAGAVGLYPSGTTFGELGYNLFFDNVMGPCVGCGTQANDLFVDPLFVDAPSGDLRLRPDSPARDAGLDLFLDVNGPADGDFNGAAPDLGGLESPD